MATMPAMRFGLGNGEAVVGRHRDDIQGLRAVAVLLVVLGHAGVSFAKGGFVGVDVFFVLSGFLITGLLLADVERHRYVSLVGFYVRRARRILPAATLTLVASSIAAYYLLNFVRAKEYLEDSIWAAAFAANIDFAHQGTDYFARSQPPSPIQHFWSLAVEEQFYLVWPALFALALGVAVTSDRPGRGSRGSSRLYAVVIAITLGSLGWSIYATSASPNTAFFSTFARAWELGLGALLAIAAPALGRVPPRWRLVMGWAGLLAIAGAALLYSPATPFPGFAALMPAIGAALVIGAGIGERPPRLGVARALSAAAMRYVGDRSYSLYLWHWPILVIAEQHEGHDLSVGVNLLLALGAFLLSIVTFRFVENPLRRMRLTVPARTLWLWPASFVLVLCVSGTLHSHIAGKEVRLADQAVPLSTVEPSATPDLSAALTRSTAATTEAPGVLPSVRAAVKQAVNGAGVPEALAPPVSQLLNDHYDYPAGCSAHDGQTTHQLCRLGNDSSSRTLVVFGDSHAQMWMPAILAMAEVDGWTVVPVAKSSCTPLLWLGGPGGAECRDWYKWAVPQTRGLHPEVTLIAGAYSNSTGRNADAAINGISSLVNQVSRSSKKVVVVGDIPRADTEPVDCLLRRNATLARCMTRATPADFEVSARVAAIAGNGFIDPLGWFCDGAQCPMVIGHTISYSDTNHVTQTYARQLAAPFATAFEQAIRH